MLWGLSEEPGREHPPQIVRALGRALTGSVTGADFRGTHPLHVDKLGVSSFIVNYLQLRVEQGV